MHRAMDTLHGSTKSGLSLATTTTPVTMTRTGTSSLTLPSTAARLPLHTDTSSPRPQPCAAHAMQSDLRSRGQSRAPALAATLSVIRTVIGPPLQYSQSIRACAIAWQVLREGLGSVG